MLYLTFNNLKPGLTSLKIVRRLEAVVVVLQALLTLLQPGEVGREPVRPQTPVVSSPPTGVWLLDAHLGGETGRIIRQRVEMLLRCGQLS